MIFIFSDINLDIGLSRGSFTEFRALLRSPSVKIPLRFPSSITNATPKPFLLTSINVFDNVVFGETLGKSFPLVMRSLTFVISLFPNFPPG